MLKQHRELVRFLARSGVRVVGVEPGGKHLKLRLDAPDKPFIVVSKTTKCHHAYRNVLRDALAVLRERQQTSGGIR
jgi:hypothetical protein